MKTRSHGQLLFRNFELRPTNIFWAPDPYTPIPSDILKLFTSLIVFVTSMKIQII